MGMVSEELCGLAGLGCFGILQHLFSLFPERRTQLSLQFYKLLVYRSLKIPFLSKQTQPKTPKCFRLNVNLPGFEGVRFWGLFCILIICC